jgi:hypothetical protein
MLGMALLFCLVGVVRAWDTRVSHVEGRAVRGLALADNGFVLLSDAFQGSRPFLQRVDGNGLEVWRSALLGDEYVISGTALGSDRACLSGTIGTPFAAARIVVECYALSDGRRLWNSVVIENGIGRESAAGIGVLNDGGAVVIMSGAGVTDQNGLPVQRHARITSSGSIAHDTVLPSQSTSAVFDTQGNMLVFAGDSSVARVSPNGQTTYTTDLESPYGLVRRRILLSSDGIAFVIGADPIFGELKLVRLSSDGHPVWFRTIARSDYSSILTRLSADDVFVWLDGPRSNLGAVPYQSVSRIRLSDGAALWTQPFGYSNDLKGTIIFDSQTKHIGLLSSRNSAMRVQVLDGEHGVRFREFWGTCAGFDCVNGTGYFDVSGALHAFSRSFRVGGPGNRVFLISRLDRAAFAEGFTRADQAGISGAWYPEYASGQGFQLHYFADSRTLFMPWFTFTSSGGSGATPLRWYALQGTVAPGAQSVALDIIRNQGGNFDAAPTTQPERVGSATIAFSSCDRANLDYNFDSALALGSGRITLTRLTPRDAPCTLADGTVSPPTVTTTASGGFETRHSGAWYDPATSGQGLMFSITPASGSNGGVFFAPWFTYDPQGAHDETTRQHWFTIQGELRNAIGGVAELAIYRTTGGTFDVGPATNTSRVGTATVRMLDCQRAQLDYRFDDTDTAGAFRARAGSINLQRIGGCAG